jgi:hypothetical protein
MQWYKHVYARNARGVDASMFARLLAPTNAAELWQTGIARVPSGKSPGHDGVSIDLWKLAAKPRPTAADCVADSSRHAAFDIGDDIDDEPLPVYDADLDPESWRLPPGAIQAPPALQLLVELANAGFALRHVSLHNKHGMIKLLPKLDENDTFSGEPAKMRPITLLPEMGKIISRVLARRLANRLAHNPRVLNPAQRAFQHAGSINQALDALVDVIEDFN